MCGNDMNPEAHRLGGLFWLEDNFMLRVGGRKSQDHKIQPRGVNSSEKQLGLWAKEWCDRKEASMGGLSWKKQQQFS